MQEPIERLKKLGDTLRSRTGVDYATARFDLRHESVRVEFFRGKDFERYFLANPKLLDEYVKKSGNKTDEERIQDLGLRFIKAGLITKAQRKFKKPKPGKKRLVKWPRTLLPISKKEVVTWERDVFYVWGYQRPVSSWMYILSFFLVFGVIAGCLLPIAPYIVKLTVFYISASLLFAIIGFLLIRTGAWFLVWLVTGCDFWILPNVMSDELPLKEAFTPIVSYTKGEGIKSHFLLRLMSACGLAVLCWFLLSRNPGGKVVKDRAKEAHDIILDFLSIKDPSQQIAEKTESEEL
eukprot:g9097.t1